MKKQVLGSLVAISLASTGFSAFSLMDKNINGVFSLDGKVSYDSNLQQQPAGPTKISDTIFELSPGLTLSNAQGAAVQSTLTGTGNFTRYDKNPALRTNLGVVDFTAAYTGGPDSATFNAGYHQLNQVTPVLGTPGLLRSNDTTVAGGDVHKVSDSLKLGVNVSYDHVKYLTPGLANSTVYTVPFTSYWAINPTLDGTVGLQYKKTDLTAGNPPYTDYYYNVGLKGEMFNPNLTGSATVGLNEHRGSVTPLSSGNSSSLGVDTNLKWVESAVDTFVFTLSNRFGAASSGQEQQTLSINLSDDHTIIDKQLIANVSLGYSIINYSGTRKDDYWDSSFGLTYNLSATWAANLKYTYQNNASNQDGSSFNDNTVALTITLKY